ncbi:hypothetical protein [Cohnella hashimotonis]|uniref:DUF3450 domain-containing protein n=1 Tax=Cohnella hashimotonis TaxID=2826895 RepID=A0ABT6TM84_9BACL|nr:hypothetical protein [Cohnella hashimotonis]MDI4647953.1 hypothetical protein [Cohnella hashimotonis]
MAKKGWIISVSLAAAVIFIFLAQNKKIESLRLQLDETKQELKQKTEEISTTRNETDAQKKKLVNVTYSLEAERKTYEEQNKVLNEELQRANAMVITNVSLLFGDRAPVVDSSIPSHISSTIIELYEAMQKNDAAKFSELDKKGVLTSFYEQRDKVEKLLWLQNDPDHRAEAVKEWLEVNNAEVRLIKVIYLMRDGSMIDPNYAMVRENGKWVLFRAD